MKLLQDLLAAIYRLSAKPERWTLVQHASTGWRWFTYPTPDVLPVKPWHSDGDTAFTQAPTKVHPKDVEIRNYLRSMQPKDRHGEPRGGGLLIYTGDTTPNEQGVVEGYTFYSSTDNDTGYQVVEPGKGGDGRVEWWDGANWPSGPFGWMVRMKPANVRPQGWPAVYSDRKVNVVDRVWRTISELQHFERHGGRVRVHGAKQINLDRPSSEARGTSAAKQPVSELCLRYQHVIGEGWTQRTSMAVLKAAGARPDMPGAILAPAEGSDGTSTDPHAMPFGACLVLTDEAYNRIMAMRGHPQAKAVAECFRLGIMNVDSAGNNFVAFEPDPRWDQDDLAVIRDLSLDDFRVMHY